MGYHRTETGHIEKIDEWGHGRPQTVNDKTPCVIFFDDGDGHYEAWKFSGKRRDALEKLASFNTYGSGERDIVEITSPNSLCAIRPEEAPEGFIERDEDGEFVGYRTDLFPQFIVA